MNEMIMVMKENNFILTIISNNKKNWIHNIISIFFLSFVDIAISLIFDIVEVRVPKV